MVRLLFRMLGALLAAVFCIHSLGIPLMGCGRKITAIPAGDGGTPGPDTTSPTLPSNKLRITILTDSSIGLSWSTATDNATASGSLTYSVYRSGANPAYGSFDTVAEVEAGNLVESQADMSAILISSGIVAGNSYYFNVVVFDGSGNKIAYTPVGAYFDASLDLHYTFDGDATDVSLTGNDGTLNSTPSPTADRFGFDQSAFRFVRTSSQNIVSGANLSISGAAARTLAFWIRADAGSYAGNDRPICFGNNANAEAFGIFIHGSTTGDYDLWAVGGANDIATGEAPSGDWEHWAIVYDGSNFTGYLNGTLVDSQARALDTGGGANTRLYIGSSMDSGNYFSGALDDVFVYTSDLTAAEVLRLYTVTRP